MSDGRSGNWAKAEPMALLMSQKIRDSAIHRRGGLLRACPMAGALGGSVAAAGGPARVHPKIGGTSTANKESIVIDTNAVKRGAAGSDWQN